jgi:hypothetical protein
MDPNYTPTPTEPQHDWELLTARVTSCMAADEDHLDALIAATAQAGEALGDEACELADRACVEAGLLEPV